MKKIIVTFLWCAFVVSASAQHMNIPFPVVYEGPDVVFRQIDEHLWMGSGNVMYSESLYIVEGEDRAVLIDAGTKIPGLDKIVEQITDKPYDVILTHVHPDHAGGCDNFDEIWLHKADEAALPANCPGYKGKIRYLNHGDKIDLGGRVLEVYHTPGHTPGSVTFVDKANHYGFSGDAYGNGNLLVFTDLSTVINTCIKTLEWMQANDIYQLWNGHCSGYNQETTRQIYNLQRICEDLLSGKAEGKKNQNDKRIWIYTRLGLNVNYVPEALK